MSDCVEDDHQLSEEATECSDDLLVLLAPAIDFGDILLQDSFNRLSWCNEGLFNCGFKFLALGFLSQALSLSSPGLFLSLLLRSGFFLSLLDVCELLFMLSDLLDVGCAGFLDVSGDQGVGVGAVAAHLPDHLLSLLEEPRQDILVEDLLSEAIAEVAEVLEEDESVAL